MTTGVNRDQESRQHLVFDRLQRLKQCRAHRRGAEIVRPHLYHAGSGRPGGGQHRPVIKIVCQDHPTFVICPSCKFGVRGIKRPDVVSVDCVVSRGLKELSPCRREVHVDHEPHAETGNGTSRSSARQAA